jgi:hypothetical protein
LEQNDYTVDMARRRKDPKLRMANDLRIPVTGDQKRLIVAATNDEPQGMAAWARAVLIQAAEKKLARRERPEDKED